MSTSPAGLDTHSGLVLFSAPWVTLGAHVAALIDEHAPEQQLIQIDVEATPAIADQHQIQSLPTILHLAEGEERGRHLGALGPGELATLTQTGS